MNKATRLSVMIESDQGYEALDSILAFEGIDIVPVGAADWGAASGLYGAAAKTQLGPKVEHVLTAAAKAGRITSLGVFDCSNLDRYCDLGVRIFFVNVTARPSIYLLSPPDVFRVFWGNVSRGRGRGMWVWTVEEEEEMREMIEMGVGGIITNYPDRLNSVLAEV